MQRLSSPFAKLALGFLLNACSGAGASPPGTDGGVVNPDSGLSVQVSVSSAVLGDQGCTGAARGSAAICVRNPDGGNCISPNVCRPSSIQLDFIVAPGGTSGHVAIADVELLDATGAKLETLMASSPQAWDASTSTYVAWDETLSPASELKASYTLSSPSWSTHDQAFSATYRLRVTLVIDGVTTVVQSGSLNREPVVAT